ncbi:MAG: hypothetical protein AAFQ09_05190 [Pseudomonadota bacterium]
MAFILVLPCCTEFPALDDTISDAARDAPYPDLQPLPTLAPAQSAPGASLEARIAALQARADRLRQIDIAALQ